MIFNEDAILLQLFQIYEDEEDLKQAVLKYCNGGLMEMARPAVIDASKGDPNELDQVITLSISIISLLDMRYPVIPSICSQYESRMLITCF